MNNDTVCEICDHWFYKYHEETERELAHYQEDVKSKCVDCRKCIDDQFDNIINGVKELVLNG